MIDLGKISKYIFCAFVFLLPFFFIPQISVPQVLNEKALLLFFAFSVFFIRLLDVFISQKVVLKDSPIQKLMILLSASFLISSVFSKNIFLSFWGKPVQADSLIVFLACLTVFYCARWLKRRDVMKILEFFVTGSVILSILYLVQSFTKTSLSLFDNLAASGVVISIALTLLISFVFNNVNYFRKGQSYNPVKVSSMTAFFVIFFFSLLLIGSRISWFFVAIGSFFIFWRSLIESDFKFRRKKAVFSLLLLLTFLSLFFLPNPLGRNRTEAGLSYDSSWIVAERSLGESVKNFFIGSGPSTYPYQFSMYKPADLSDQSVFDEGAIPLLTFSVTVGLLGTLSFLLLLIFFYYQGFKYFLDFRRERKDTTVNVRDIIFPVVFCLSLLMFFYKVDVASFLLLFMVLGLWDGQQKGEERVFEISLWSKNIRRIVFSLIFILFAWTVFNFFNYYRAEKHYQTSVENFKNGGAASVSIENMEKAAGLWKHGDYNIWLSKLYMIKAKEDFEQNWTTKDKKEQQMNSVKDGAAKAEIYAKLACAMNPKDAQSWQNLGWVYENNDYLIKDTTDDAIAAYEKAEALAPTDYESYFGIGRMLEAKGQDEEALQEYKKAFALYKLDPDLTKKIESLQ